MGMFAINSTVKRLLLILATVGVLSYWIKWSIDVRVETATSKLETIIEARDKTIAELRKEIEGFTSSSSKLDKEFETIDESQIDLLCAARGHADSINPMTMQKPTIVEVVKWRERKAQCPTSERDNSAPQDPLPVISEEIAMQSLNNSWKAYCITVNNEDDICIPFQQ